MSSPMPKEPHRNSPKPHHERTHSSTSWFTFPVSHVVSGLSRRFTEPPQSPSSTTYHPDVTMGAKSANNPQLYNPPQRTASPFAPPPLTGLTLRGARASSFPSRQILTKTLAEEIRLLLPPRLQLTTDWSLAYSIEQDGTSLGTLYEKCATFHSGRNGYVLVVNDSSGGVSTLLSIPPDRTNVNRSLGPFSRTLLLRNLTTMARANASYGAQLSCLPPLFSPISLHPLPPTRPT